METASRGSASTLVIENDPTDGPARLGEWLVEGGLDLDLIRAHTGAALPDDLTGYAGLVVLGGEQDAFPDVDGTPAEPWFPQVEALLRKAVRHRVPTLAICLGGQLLAQALGGTVERSTSGPELGARLVAKRDVATEDPLFAAVPFAPDVIQWHFDEITELPAGATLMAASPRYPHQAFRVGDRAWATQFHIECDRAMFAGWVADNAPWLAEQGWDPDRMLAGVEEVLDDVEQVWRPFAHRFAQLVRGELVTRAPLPLVS